MTMIPTLPRPNAFATVDAIPSLSRKLIQTVREWRHRAGARRELMALDDRWLWDMGLTRYDAQREAGKPFWRK
jgi:uncharacterized protein YjiS (DUF1127 family)